MKYFLASLIFFHSAFSWSAACCGGAAQIASLITAEDSAQFTTMYSFENYKYDVDSNGYWVPVAHKPYSQSLKLDYARFVSEKSQIGVSLPLKQNGNNDENSSAIKVSDISITYGHRFFDQDEVTQFFPQYTFYTSLILPTGTSLEDSSDFYKLDVTGKGDYTPLIGSLFIYDYSSFDFSLNIELHRSLDRKVNNANGKYLKKYGAGGSFTLGAGWNKDKIRIGGSLSQSYEDPVELSGDFNSISSVKKTTAGTLAVSYMMPEFMSLTLSYTDQALLGEPINTSLGTTWALSFQKRWARY